MAMIKVFIHASIETWNKNKVSYSAWPSDMSKAGYVPIQEVEVDFEEAPFEQIAAGTVKAMREEQARLRAEAALKVTQLEERIQKLLCIENKPSNVPDEV